MTRRPIDIEELFRELTGSRGEGRPPSGGASDPPTPPPGADAGRRLWLAVVVGFGGFMLLSLGVNVWTEWLWFDSLTQAATFRTRLLAPWAIFGGMTLIGALWLAAHWGWAVARISREAAFPGQRTPWSGRMRMRTVVPMVALLAAVVVAAGAAGGWENVLLWRARQPFGVEDPIFGRDVGFYVWQLPLWRWLQGIGWTLLLMSLVGAGLLYLLGGAVQLDRGLPRLRGPARGHLSLLLALGALLWAAGQWLARWEILFRRPVTGAFFGPGYADVQARLPGLTATAVLGVAIAVAFLLAARFGRAWVPAALIALAVVVQIGLVELAPSFVQQFQVTPNELDRERPYIAHNIDMTRRAYGLDEISEVAYEPRGALSAELLDRHQDTMDNVRLWDWRVLQDTFRQLQEIRPYYEFFDVDVDRYALGGGTRQVLLSAREMTSNVLPNRTWVNRHLKFTHGHGVVITPVDEVTRQGLPRLWAQDIPVSVREPFDRTITQPRIYFGESNDLPYVIVNTPGGEFDYTSEGGDATNRYDGQDGVTLGSRLKRLLFAMRVGDIEVLLGDEVTAESRILLRRRVQERVSAVAPFLAYDEDPYLVVTEGGRLVWLLDAYAYTDRFPYARPLRASGRVPAVLDGASYVRNSVKVVVDAYDGRPELYIVDEQDPVIATWARVFPELFRTADEMPEDLRAHWRYPEALFSVQAEIYARYHMDEPEEFYNAEDLWVIPTESFEQGSLQAVEPYYVTMRLRGEEQAEFLLMQPFTPANKDNLIAWMAARNDPPHYGELVVYAFSTGQQFYGPQQIESRIDQDTEISQQLTLWSQSGSRVIRGNMLIIPIEDSLLYVEPLYLRAESGSSALPELKRVIVADNESVVMRETLDEALAALVDAGAPAVDRIEGVPEPSADAEDEGSEPDARPPSARGAPAPPVLLDVPADADAATLARAARAREQAAAAALRDGDWRAFGREMAALQSLLARLEAVTGDGTFDLDNLDARDGSAEGAGDEDGEEETGAGEDEDAADSDEGAQREAAPAPLAPANVP